ncbi:MAG: hypothetical protein ACO1PN_08785 [Betaproteobacteria bacterium]
MTIRGVRQGVRNVEVGVIRAMVSRYTAMRPVQHEAGADYISAAGDYNYKHLILKDIL